VPNPRLQRTRSASPPSPLSRQPLGVGRLSSGPGFRNPTAGLRSVMSPNPRAFPASPPGLAGVSLLRAVECRWLPAYRGTRPKGAKKCFSCPNISLQRTPARGFLFSDSSGFVCGPSPLSSWSLARTEDEVA